MEPVLVVHGGAGAWSAIHHDSIPKGSLEEGVAAAARAGWARLGAPGGSAVDAVQAAVMAMEDDPHFNAGTGSCLTTEGEIEMDAVIQDGRSMRTGGVMSIRNVRHPVAVARDVMDKSPHVLFSGEGALRFAREQGHEDYPTALLLTDTARARLEAMPVFEGSRKVEFKPHGDLAASGQSPPGFPHPSDHDTVGAVALDAQGNVAFATSTGGITAKLPGRVGDSPIVGCGGYADTDIGAISTTGHGESFVKIATGKHIANLMSNGESAQAAVEKSLAYLLERVGGRGGAIAVNKDGGVGVAFNTDGMAWAIIKDGQLKYGVYPGECTATAFDTNTE